MAAARENLLTPNEDLRQRALNGYYLAGTAPEKLFDDLAGLVARLFQAPVGLVSLVDAESVWFKANAGLPGATRVPREDSLCSVVVLKGEPTVFENLEKAPCALVNPDVARALELRFYAGAPLTDAEGHHIGALCVMDHAPRPFSPAEQALLARLAGVVMRTIELRLAAIYDPNPDNLQLQLAFNALNYSIERISDLAPAPAGDPAADRQPNYRVVNEIIDYVQGFLAGTLKTV